MATVTITTDVAPLFSHDVYFELTLENSATESYSARLLDLGNLSYEFDIPNSGEDATAIGVKSGSLDVTLEDYTTDGADQISEIIESAYNYGSKPFWWIGKMYYREHGGTYGNPVIFKFTSDDVSISESKKTVELTLNPFQVPAMADGQSYDSVFEFMNFFGISTFSYYDLSYSPTGDETNSDAMLAGEFIRSVLYKGWTDNFFSWPPASEDEPVFKSNVFVQGEVGVDAPTTGTEWFIVQNTKNIEGANTNNLINAIQTVGILASLEGAIFGNALGKSFYVNRTNTDNTVTLDWDNVLDPKKRFFYENQYSSVYLEHNEESVEEYSSNFGGEKKINIVFDQSGIYRASISSGTACTETTFTDEIIQEGITVYPKAFGFDGETSITLGYWGIDGILPYSVINFDVNAPSYYQSKNFRIKKIDYNWKQDKVEMEIYQI